MTTEKKTMVTLAAKQQAMLLGQDVDGNTVDLRIPVGGLIAAKEGKTTHVVTSGTMQVARADGRVITIQVNAWYK